MQNINEQNKITGSFLPRTIDLLENRRLKSVLIVDDDPVFGTYLKNSLHRLGYEVSGIALTGEDAIEFAKTNPPDLILIDINPGAGINGIQTAERICEKTPLPGIVITANDDPGLIKQADATPGLCGYLPKPFSTHDLDIVIRFAFLKYETERQIHKIRAEQDLRAAEQTRDYERKTRMLLREQEVFGTVFHNASDIILLYEMGPDGIPGNYLMVNDTGCRFLGYTREEMLTLSPPDIIPPQSRQSVPAFTKSGEVPEPPLSEKVYRQKNGQEFPVEVRTHAFVLQGKMIVLDIARDISEGKRAEEALLESKEIYRSIFENTGTAMAVAGPDTTLLSVNRKFEHLSGFGTPELVGKKSWTDLVAQEDSRKMMLLFQAFREDPELTENHSEFRLITKEGSSRFVFFTIGTLPGTQNYILSLIDITPRKKAEDALHESEATYRGMIKNIQDIYYRTDAGGTIIMASPSATRIFGYDSLDDIIGTPMERFWKKPDERKELLQRIEEDGRVSDYEIILKKGDGTSLPASVTGFFYRDCNGAVLGVEGIIRDITERKYNEEQLKRSKERYRNVVEDQTEFICRFAPDGTLTFVNDAYCRYFNLEQDDCIGRPQLVTIPPEDADLLKTHFAALTPENPAASVVHRIIMPDSEVRWQEWTDRAIFNGSGTVVEYQSVGRDFTRYKQIEIELNGYRKNLEKMVKDRTVKLTRLNKKLLKEVAQRQEVERKLIISSDEKDVLLREVHHRVKNNLQIISGLLDMTQMRSNDSKVNEILTDIMLKIQTMGQIHTRLYESKRFDRVNMKDQIREQVDALSRIYSGAGDRDIATHIECSTVDLPVDQAIPAALVLNEILSNTYKHAFRGRKHGTVMITADRDEDNFHIIVRDDGIGIPTGFDINLANRLGLKLIRTLVQQQLKGNFSIRRDNGTEVVVEFPIQSMESEHGKYISS